MIRKNLLLHSCLCVLLLIVGIQQSYSGETKVGGHFKLTLFDYSMGDRAFTDTLGIVQKADGARYAGMSISRFTLLVMQEIKEIFSILVQPNFEVATGATPRVGRSIGEKHKASAPKFVGWHKAFMRILIPYPLLVEVSGGVLFPRFTMDYGAELFFEDEYNGSPFAVSNWLGEMHGTGFEFYKTIELGFASMPTYIYLLNGSNNLFHDNNDSPEAMIHIEPEIGPVRLFGSFLAGKYDDEGEKNLFRWSGGASLTLGRVELRSEYAAGKWEESLNDSATTDGMPYGFYGKLFYQFSDWGKAMIHYSYARYNFIGTPIGGPPGKEIYSTITPGLHANLFDCLGIQLQCDIGDWEMQKALKNTKDELNFYRFFLGIRATF